MARILIPGVGYADDAQTGQQMLPGGGYVLVAGAGDVTPPTLTSPTGSQTGSSTATVGATTDEGNGTLYAVVSASSTAPTAAQVKAGQTHAGAAAPWSGNQAISSTGAKTLNASGLTSSTTYYAHLMHEDAASNQSSVVSSSGFTTAAESGGGLLPKLMQLIH